MAIIKSLLDTDFYKLTMAQAVLHQYPAVTVRYKFNCRNDKKIPYLDEIKEEIDHLCSLRFQDDEIRYLSTISFFKADFIDYLRLFQLNRDYIKVSLDDNQSLKIDIEGPWISTILFEVPVLAIVSEIYSRHQIDKETAYETGGKLLDKKTTYLTDLLKTGQVPGFKFADFGTRRRYSRKWHAMVLDVLRSKFRPHLFVGTTNVHFAMRYKLKPIGTMSHEWLMAHQQLGVRFADSQRAALDDWAQEYRGDMGIVLSDVVGFKAFLRDFDLYFAKLFDGCRHDSGDPVSWCVKLIEHYDKLGIDPLTKSAIFSDSINFETAVELHQTFHEMIKVSFGIGTQLTNDVGIPPADIVIKMVECNGQPVAKICDSDGRGMCEDPEFVAYLKKVYQIS
ncbi:MAG: nicotinate phosphoribosyltransferase [Thermodesulfobacteriota bacterium]